MRPAATVRLVYAPAGDVIVPAAKPVAARLEYEPDGLDSARDALAQLAEQRRAERDRAASALMRDHARFVPTDARLCGDGGAGLFGESHSETVRSAARRGQSE